MLLTNESFGKIIYQYILIHSGLFEESGLNE